MATILHQLHRLHTGGDVLCAIDAARALPDYRHRFFVKLAGGVEPRVAAQADALGIDVVVGATVGQDDLAADVCAVLYHCIGFDESRPGDFVAFRDEPPGVTCAAWIHTPGQCGERVTGRYASLQGKGISRFAFNSTYTREQTPDLDLGSVRKRAVIPPTAGAAHLRHIVRTDAAFRIGRWSRADNRKYADDFLSLIDSIALPGVEFECMGVPRKFRGVPAPAGLRWLESHAMPLERFLGRLDILLFKTDARTWHEGWCRTVTEAMAAGVVPVVERRGGITDQVRDGYNGFLCDSNAEFRAACELLFHEPELRLRLSANARTFVESSFNLSRLRRELLDLLDLSAADVA